MREGGKLRTPKACAEKQIENELEYWKSMKLGLEYAERRISEDIKICKKQIATWEQRQAKQSGRARA